MSLNLMLRFIKNEFMGYIKRPVFPLFLFLLSLIMLLLMNYRASELNDPVKSLTTMPLLWSNIVTSLFLAFLASQSVAKEFEQRTLNILLTTPLTRWEIYLGKMMALFLLIPIVMVFNALYILSLPSAYGVLPAIVVDLIPYELLLSSLYFASTIALTMFLSVVFRKASLVLIIMVVFTVLTAFVGLPAVITYQFDYKLDYGLIFMMPPSLMVSGLLIADSFCVSDGNLPSLQLVFILAFMMVGALLFRRSELWG